MTTGTISEFKVWGFHENEGETKTFMDGVAVNRINDSWTYSPTQFWPEAGPSTFSRSVRVRRQSRLTKLQKRFPILRFRAMWTSKLICFMPLTMIAAKKRTARAGWRSTSGMPFRKLCFRRRTSTPNWKLRNPFDYDELCCSL